MLHLLLVLLIIRPGLSKSSQEPADSGESPTQVSLIPLEPPPAIPPFVVPPPEPPPPPPPPQPPPERSPVLPEEDVPLGPDSEHPELPPQNGEKRQELEDAKLDPDGDREPAPTARAEPPSVRRIERASEYFQRLGLAGSPLFRPILPAPSRERQESTNDREPLEPLNGAPRFGPSPLDSRRWTNSPTATGRCPEIPDLGVDENGTPNMASVIGRILAQDRRGPLVGAHLQLIGTSFITFTDARGEYELKFDPKMLAHCRTQYVRVTAPGFRTELLVLSIGQRIRSDDVVMRRK